jgi:RsiW-degrading membrane proteinase PrsW (M82 family)
MIETRFLQENGFLKARSIVRGGSRMQETFCCVCHVPVPETAKRIGSRRYCDRHYQKVTQDRRGLWISTAVGIVALLAFVGLVSLITQGGSLVLTGTSLVLVGITLALVPAVIWMGIFYAQDRLEPEPKRLVLGIFVLGVLLAQAVGIPAVRDLFRVQDWLPYNGAVVDILGSILVVGFVQEYLKYAGVRFTIFGSTEFDERVDGIIYGAAIGLGFATMLHIDYVIGSGGVRPGVGVIRIVVGTLAQASFAGVSGYFLGRAKFEDMPAWWLPAGVTLAAVLNGVVSFLLQEVSVQGLQFTPIYGLILAAVVAAATFTVLFALIRRTNAAALAGT